EQHGRGHTVSRKILNRPLSVSRKRRLGPSRSAAGCGSLWARTPAWTSKHVQTLWESCGRVRPCCAFEPVHAFSIGGQLPQPLALLSTINTCPRCVDNQF